MYPNLDRLICPLILEVGNVTSKAVGFVQVTSDSVADRQAVDSVYEPFKPVILDCVSQLSLIKSVSVL